MTERIDPSNQLYDEIHAVLFSANGQYLLTCDNKGVRVWRVEDGQNMATLEGSYVECLAVSKDGRWIAAGTMKEGILMWHADTYQKAWSFKSSHGIQGVDFSPSSTRLVAASKDHTAFVLDSVTGERVDTLQHDNSVIAARYSPHGDCIATATYEGSVRVWDSNNGRLLVDIKMKVTPTRNDGLVWSNTQLLVVCEGAIKRIEASTGLVDSEWLAAPGSNQVSCITLSPCATFIAYSAKHTITFWDTSTQSQLDVIQHPQETLSIAVSPDERCVAIGGKHGEITVKWLSRITEPILHIDDAVLDSWKHDQLSNAEELLTKAILTSRNPNPHILASRALVRTHLRQWDVAIADARESIRITPTIIGYIARSVALVGKGERQEGYRACDIAFEHSHSLHVSFLLMVKAVIVFMAGEHDDAISRVNDLIDTVEFNSACHVIQAYMYLCLGKSRMESCDYEGAIQLYKRAQAQAQMRPRKNGGALLVVSLISGWKFDNLIVTIQRQLCESLYAAGHAKEASDLVLEMLNTFGKEIYKSEALIGWVSDFSRQCLITPECGGYLAQDDVSPILHSTPSLPNPSPLLREWAKATLLTNDAWTNAITTSVNFMAPRSETYRVICEYLEAIDRVSDASVCFLQMMNERAEETTTHDEQAEWAVAFKMRCAKKLEHHGDVAADAHEHDIAITQYSASLSLDPVSGVFMKRSKAYIAKGLWEDARRDANQVIKLDSSSKLDLWSYENVLTEWATINLTGGLWKGVLSAAYDFGISKVVIRRTLCESLEAVEGILEAIECFHEMAGELESKQGEWVFAFQIRCREKLDRLGNAALGGQRHDEAHEYYSAALSICPPNTPGYSIWRSKMSMAKGLWEDAVNDANEAIRLDPSLPWGYGMKHAALHGARRYDDAIQTFETMCSKMKQSSNVVMREHLDRYISPTRTREVIRRTVQRITRHLPRVLINTATGRLQNRDEQASAFMSLPIVNELISSTTTHLNRGRIKREVKQFFRYVMLSHKWEDDEPLFQHVMHKAVYDLDHSPTHDKLQMFCKVARDAGYVWAWSDTCCIDKRDQTVLQEALVAMFGWYRGSALMIVFLRGVRSPWKLDDLVRSIWNTRAWTLQEYVAAKVIQFYTEDWTPYLDLDMFNHKKSRKIILEMARATGLSAKRLTALRPGLSSIREKLQIASKRHATLIEDAAYSLLGIFLAAGISPMYGEGEKALGRLLAHILAGSRDASILAWTGQSGSYNSCLPAHINVFKESASSHIPSPIEDDKMERIVSTLRTATDLNLTLDLYDCLSQLPAPLFEAGRVKLPCIAFKLPPFSPYRTRSGRVYRADTPVFGMVEIKTRQNPSRLNSLYLVHPWLDALLDREDMQTGTLVEDDVAEPFSPCMDDEDMSDEEIEDDFADTSLPRVDDEVLEEEIKDDSPPFPEHKSSPPPVHPASLLMDKETRALRLVAHLRQPFGALLLTPTSTRRRSVVYRRVAADSEITVQLRESVPLGDILDNIRILDVL